MLEAFKVVKIIPQNSLSIFEGRDKEWKKEFAIPSIRENSESRWYLLTVSGCNKNQGLRLFTRELRVGNAFGCSISISRSRNPCCSAKKPFLHFFPPLSYFPLFSSPRSPDILNHPRTMIPLSLSLSPSLPQFLAIASTRSSNRNCRYLSVSFSFSGRWKSRNIEVFGQCPILTIRPYLRRAPNPDSTRLDSTPRGKRRLSVKTGLAERGKRVKQTEDRKGDG